MPEGIKIIDGAILISSIPDEVLRDAASRAEYDYEGNVDGQGSYNGVLTRAEAPDLYDRLVHLAEQGAASVVGRKDTTPKLVTGISATIGTAKAIGVGLAVANGPRIFRSMLNLASRSLHSLGMGAGASAGAGAAAAAAIPVTAGRLLRVGFGSSVLGALVGAAVSVGENIYAVATGHRTLQEAKTDLITDLAIGAVVGASVAVASVAGAPLWAAIGVGIGLSWLARKLF